MRRRARFRNVAGLCALALGLAACGDFDYRAGWLRGALDPRPPSVAWEPSSPEAEGLDAEALEGLARDLARSGTRAFLVARHGRIVFEWYHWRDGASEPLDVAAMTKPLVGALAFVLGVGDGLFDFDTPASRYVPEWRGDPQRGRIRVVDLVTHGSGLEDVDFPAGSRGELSGWHRRYYEDLGGRFRAAATQAPVLFEPGSAYQYSGVGYYAFAYLLGRALAPGDVASLLDERLYGPLGIPAGAWETGYGRVFEVDGLRLQAVGSGGRFTARAVARVATLVMQGGLWQGRQLLDPAVLERLHSIEGEEPVTIDRGWWVNGWGLSPSLPRDSLIGVGRKHQLVIAVPSLSLVAVRLGDSLEPGTDESTQFEVGEERLFAPLMGTLER